MRAVDLSQSRISPGCPQVEGEFVDHREERLSSWYIPSLPESDPPCKALPGLEIRNPHYLHYQLRSRGVRKGFTLPRPTERHGRSELVVELQRQRYLGKS